MLEVVEQGSAIYLVTEFVGGGELFAHIVNKGRLEEAEAMRLFAQMVAAVDSCHRQLVIHRDLKPENVLLDASGDIKVRACRHNRRNSRTCLQAAVLHPTNSAPRYCCPLTDACSLLLPLAANVAELQCATSS